MNWDKKVVKSLGRAISVINKRLDKEDKIAHKIYINGHAIKDNSIVDVKNLKVIEVITKSQGGIILESIVDARGYIDKYFSMFEALGIDDQGILTEEEEVKLIEMLIFLRWFYNLF